MLAGCRMIDTAAPAASQATPLSWLTNWVSQPTEMAPGFDVESIKPDPQPAAVAVDELIEITVWDLYEPGRPHSFPVRVSQRLTVEVPFLGEVAVAGRTIPELEVVLADGFRKGDFLLNPRVLVRSLDPPMLKVQVTGAVNRSGFVELARTDPSVYAAILSAGGLKKTAAAQVAVTRHSAAIAAAQPEIRSEPAEEASAVEAGGAPAGEEVPAPALRANSLDEISVSPAPPNRRPSAVGQALFDVADPEHSATAVASSGHFASTHEPETTVWYDVTLARDRDELQRLRLADGDIVTVKAAMPPLRIGGAVNRPGAYPLPPDKSLDVWQAIELAQGVRDATVPLNITLVRPAAEGRNVRRSSLFVAAYEQHPQAAPTVEPGDVLHVEPTAGGKIKRAVGNLWNKP